MACINLHWESCLLKIFGGVGKTMLIIFKCFVAKHSSQKEGNISTFLVRDLKSGINCGRDKVEETTNYLVPESITKPDSFKN